jgi:outer membrane protein OmpA-like peptidoglycan-associated protein
MLKPTISCSFFFILFFLLLSPATSIAQDDQTVKADELIDLFSPQKKAVDKEQSQPESGGTRSLGRGLGRGLGGMRTGHSGSQPQEGTNVYEPVSTPLQPSQSIQQPTSPPAVQLMPPPGQRPQQNSQTGSEVRKSFQNILFDVNAYTIRESSYRQLDEIGKALKVVMAQDPESFFIVEGHTDSEGSAEYNEKLSTRRAQMVRDFLVFKFGLDNKRIMALGYGENKPVASNENEYGRSMNRRVEIVKR